jgi:hypothetical protein
MAIAQPLPGDKLNTPGEDHASLHRIIAADTSAPAKTITVDAAGNVKLGNYTGLLVATNGALSATASLAPFYFTATSGQRVFTLASTPLAGVLLLAIYGVAQSQAAGDFTVVGANITLSQSLAGGTPVFGVYI